jgi:hypothetical protein
MNKENKLKNVSIMVDTEVWKQLKDRYGKNLLSEVRKALDKLLEGNSAL